MGGVRGQEPLHAPGLNGNHSHGDPTQAGAAHDHGLPPALQVLRPRPGVKEAALAAPVGVDDAAQEVPGVVGQGGRLELHVPVPRVRAQLAHGRQARDILGHVGEPVQDGGHALLVIPHDLVGDTVGHHDLRAAKLVLRGVDILPQELVQGRVARQDHGAANHLDVPLSQPVQVRSNAHRPSCDVGQREGLLVCPAGLTSDEATSLQVLHANAALGALLALADDGIQDVTVLATFTDLVSFHRTRRELLIVLLRQVEVLEALAAVGRIPPLDLVERLQLLHESHAGTTVARHVDPWEAKGPSKLRSLLEEEILPHAERSGLESHIVGEEDDLSALWVFWSLHCELPSQHAHVVSTLWALGLLQLHLGPVHHELHSGEEVLGHLLWHLRRDGDWTTAPRRRAPPLGSSARGALAGLWAARNPLHGEGQLEHARQVKGVRGARTARSHPLSLILPQGCLVRHMRVFGWADGRSLLGCLPSEREASHRVWDLAEHLRLQETAAQGGQREPEGLQTLGGLAVDLHLDLIDAQLDHPRAPLSHVAADGVREALLQLANLHIQLLDEVHEDAAGHGRPELRHAGVQQSMLNLLHSQIQALGEALPKGVLVHG
mmetsp:Transcript_27532/g.51629  ORF Transcript_27532/g.51629 Transcript_27532/m.51629 type:complete len:606 (+) Transcript_27532:2-1819(+)